MNLITKLTKQYAYPKYDIIPFIRIAYTNHWIQSNSKLTSAIIFEMGWFKWIYKITIEK